MHQRAVDCTIGNRDGLKRTAGTPKLKYLYPLDRAMRKQIAPLAKPYPKRKTCGQSVEGDTIGDQPIEEGSIPSVRSELYPVEQVITGE